MPLSELRDYIDDWWRPADDGRPAMPRSAREHRLKPFDRAYFEEGNSKLSQRMAAGTSSIPAGIFCAQPLPTPAIDELALDTLLAFMRNPCRGFLEQRLGVRLGYGEELDADKDRSRSIRSNSGSCARHCSTRYSPVAALPRPARASRPVASCRTASPAHGRSPGRSIPARRCWKPPARGRALDTHSQSFTLESGGLRLHGILAGLRDGRLRRISASRAHGNALLPFWINHLCGCAQS